ncbi:methyl-accepting chemotaxis protein [Vibrio maritimus]|uniref:Methyl-accepting chemotaxis protein n=1 Tax=Vibrio maritimus TaxID=990268 RepID=A0A090T1U9_9VIBR|nr:methyl-accepting chemotaxis protein [Vibrio maritimus]
MEAVTDPTLELDWRVGFMVPESLITDPIQATFWGTVTVILLVLIISGIAMLVIINRFLTKPLNNVVTAMDNIAVGEGDLTQRLEYQHDDELGKLSRSFNIFVNDIQQTTQLSLQTTEQVTNDAIELHRIAEHFGNTIASQKSYIEQIATASTEMSQTISGIADNAQTAQQHASDASMNSQQSQTLTHDASNLMNDIYQDVSKSEEVVTILNDNATAITSVLEVIKGVAEQTNLLALNAAIEAARAGEQGRGFAVVADEVRTLAQRTQKSTVDIEGIIATLQSSAANAVDSLRIGRSKTEQGVDMIAEVDNKLREIHQTMEMIDSQSQEIASMVNEQAIASGEISQQTVSVDQLAEDSVADTRKMLNKIDKQLEMVEELKKTIGKFKVS